MLSAIKINEAFLRAKQGNMKEAESDLKWALGVERSLWSEDHPSITRTLWHVAKVQTLQDDEGPEAVATWTEVLGRKDLEANRRAGANADLATVLFRMKRYAEAASAYETALAIFETLPKTDPETLVATFANLGLLYIYWADDTEGKAEKYAKAEDALKKGLHVVDQGSTPIQAQITIFGVYSLLLERTDRHEAAARLSDRVGLLKNGPPVVLAPRR